ncbi:MAG: pseudouridine synthase, partial [Candidatus Cryptobacteroides sp.]
MEDNKRGGFGRRTEGRRDYGKSDSKRTYGNKPSFGGNSNRRNFGDKPVNYGEKCSYGERNSFGEKRSYGDRPSSGRNSERPSFGEKRTYGSKPSFGGNSNHRNFGDKPSYGEKRSFGERNTFGEKRSFGDRNSFGEKRSFGDRKRTFSDRKPSGRPGAKGFGGKRNAYGDLNYFRNEDESGISRMINRRPQIDSGAYSDNDMVMTPVKEEVRLNKFIANSGICSRREADNFILAGVVTVNGEVVTELGTKININTDDVRFNGERLKGESKVYIVMNKPKGYVTTSSDPHADKTVMDLLKKCPSRVFPVGRLDKNT